VRGFHHGRRFLAFRGPNAQRWQFAGQVIDVRSIGPAESFTVDTEAQAWTRARISEQDKGGDAARAALSLIAIKRQRAKK